MTEKVISGRYELEELVGSGGMSAVYRAHDRLLERKVALKILHQRYSEDAEYLERFRREARAVAQLAHPNIVTVIDRGEDEERQFIVFEYIEGDDLKQLVERTGPLPVDDVVRLGVDVAGALAFAHERGIVHRDVKPQNVLLNGEGHAKVTDFGIARSLDVERGVTQTGTVLGTSSYIAPEQASGQPVDERSDVYSLGVVLFELLAGEVPFPGDNFVAVAMKHVNEPAPSVLERRPDAPPRLVHLIGAMLAKDHVDRPSMDTVVAELERFRDPTADAQATAVLRRPKVSRLRTARRRSPWPLALAALGAILLAAAFGVALLRDDVGTAGDGGSPAGGTPITLQAVDTEDPNGDGEHDDEVDNVTDRVSSTAWRTQRYRHPNGGLGKPGVGIVLRASRPPEALVLQTDTPGFTAEIRSGGETVSESQEVGSETTFRLPEDGEATEFLVWITNRGSHPSVRITEVTAR
jgi:eukaryotic-like serine/threonine-protein kinase